MVTMEEQGRLCKQASYQLAQLPTEKKNEALQCMASLLWEKRESILEANKKDVEAARLSGRSESFIDRLSLDEQRLAAICEGVRQVSFFTGSLRTYSGRMGSRGTAFGQTQCSFWRNRHYL